MKVSQYYVSITGLTLKSNRCLPKFLYHTIPSHRQAAAAPGNILSEVKEIDGVFHTLTVWEDKQKMRKYRLSGAHAKAMKDIGQIAKLEGGGAKVLGYESETMPSWDEALELWGKEGKVHGGRSKTANPTKRIPGSLYLTLLRRLFVQILVPCLALFLLTKTTKMIGFKQSL